MLHGSEDQLFVGRASAKNTRVTLVNVSRKLSLAYNRQRMDANSFKERDFVTVDRRVTQA